MDSTHQCMVLLLMALCPEDVCKVRIRSMTTSLITNYHHIFFVTIGSFWESID